MSALFFTLPVIAAFLGWIFTSLALKYVFHPVHPVKIFGITFQGVIPKKLPDVARLAGILSGSLFSIKQIEEKITHPENVHKMMPQAEEHIDNFLRVKLVKSMPVVGMFVGDKTINNLKSLFIKELEELFPQIMRAYMKQLEEDFDIGKLVSAKINSYSPLMIEKTFYVLMKKEVFSIKLIGTLMGLVIGIIQAFLLLLIGH